MAKFKPHLEINFYISSTSTLAFRAKFWAGPFTSWHTNILNLFIKLTNHGCVGKFVDIHGIHFEPSFFDFMQKVGKSGIRTHDLVPTMHALQPLNYLARQWDVFNGSHPTGSSDHEAQVIARWLQ